MTAWVKCNICKKPLNYSEKFWTCNVSTCNRRRTGLRFCSVSCYDAHLPMMNHRESWALEVKAPNEKEWQIYSADEGEDAVWPPPPKEVEKKEEAPLPSGGFADPRSQQGKPSVIRRKKA